jgi:hypothetical protein
VPDVTGTEVTVADAAPRPARSWSAWSLVAVVLAVPVWYAVAVQAVMSREADGGIFLSTAAGLDRGLDLYSGVWDNKDPLFFAAMALAMKASATAPLVMDWLWIPLGALGGWLIARRVMAADRALLVGLVAIPLVLIAPFYSPGLTSTPGTALVLLVLGLAMARRGVPAGIVLGLLAFTKLIAWPIGLVCLLALVLVPSTRRTLVRALVAMAATLGVTVALLAVLGWLGPYVDAVGRNRTYASDVIVYFGYADSPMGHLSRMLDEWRLNGFPTLPAAIAIVVVGLAAAIVWLARPRWRTPERGLLAAWLLVSIVGTAGVLALTFVWEHHTQAMFLPAALAVIAFAALLPERWPYPAWLVLLVAGLWLVSGTGSPGDAWNRVHKAADGFPAALAQAAEVPTDAHLLDSVPLKDFTFARLGTNDERGFLTAVRPDATLACPQFHLYDFSPPADFAAMLECIRHVDVIVETDNFDVFAKGGRAASAIPILEYVTSSFDCLRVDDRQVCTRKPGS